MDPIERVDVGHDTTFALMLEAQRRGHEVLYCTMSQLVARNAVASAVAASLHVRREQGKHFSVATPPRLVPLDDLDAVFVRTDPPFDSAYLHATHLLSLVDPRRTLVVNDPRGLREAQEHLYSLRFPDLIPDTVVSARRDVLLEFLAECDGRMVVKPVEGHGGEGVLLVDRGDPNLNGLLELATRRYTEAVIAQRMVPAIHESGDVRILILDGRVLGACARLPTGGDFRGNLAAGGRVARHTPTPREQEVCAAIGPTLRADGLHFVGIDLIGGYLTEVNVTSPTCIQEIDRLEGLCLEADVMDFVSSRVGR